MTTASNIMTGLVAALHIYFLVLEMFLWDKAAGRKAFGLTVAQAKSTKVMAANQGLYNGFLAAGLIWSLLLGNSGQHIQTFFLFCVLIAGIYGAMTASKKILFIQALPAAIALLLLFTSK